MSERFELKAEHVKLLRRANVSWDGCEYGAPSIDPKRPYGNSDVPCDIAEILGYPWDSEDEEACEAISPLLRKWHEQTKTALQVVLASGSFEPGAYEADKYMHNWRRVAP